MEQLQLNPLVDFCNVRRKNNQTKRNKPPLPGNHQSKSAENRFLIKVSLGWASCCTGGDSVTCQGGCTRPLIMQLVCCVVTSCPSAPRATLQRPADRVVCVAIGGTCRRAAQRRKRTHAHTRTPKGDTPSADRHTLAQTHSASTFCLLTRCVRSRVRVAH